MKNIITIQEKIKNLEHKLLYTLPKELARNIIKQAKKYTLESRLETLQEAYKDYVEID